MVAAVLFYLPWTIIVLFVCCALGQGQSIMPNMPNLSFNMPDLSFNMGERRNTREEQYKEESVKPVEVEVPASESKQALYALEGEAPASESKLAIMDPEAIAPASESKLAIMDPEGEAPASGRHPEEAPNLAG